MCGQDQMLSYQTRLQEDEVCVNFIFKKCIVILLGKFTLLIR